MTWIFWIPFGGFGLASLGCFVRAYAHLTPEARRPGARAVMRGALSRQNLFTARGWQLRLYGWVFAGLSLAVLALAGLLQARS